MSRPADEEQPANVAPQSFRRPRELRLNQQKQFWKVRSSGTTARGRFFRMSVFFQGGEEPSRCGFITSKKAGRAVTRNRLRRLLREIHRLHQALLIPGCWIVTIVHREASEATYQDLEREWLHLAGKLSILRAS